MGVDICCITLLIVELLGISMGKKIVFFGRFFGEKSIFGGAGKIFGWKNRK